VLTFGFLGGYYGTHNISWSQAAPFLTWASTQNPDASAIHAVGIKTTFYSNPTRVQANDPLYASPEAAFAHDCSGQRITDSYKNKITQYVMDPSTSALRNSFLSMVVQPTIAAGTFDAIYEDNAGPLSEYGPTYFKPGYPCNYSDASWVSNDAGLEGSLPLPVIFNGLSGLNPYGGYGISLSTGLFQNASTMGGVYEHCYTQDSSSEPKEFGNLWQAVENTEISVAQQARDFVCNPTDRYAPAGSSRQIDERLYSYASFLLTYDVNTSTLWDKYPTGASGFPVNPESQLVVLNPLIATPSDISGLKQSTGVYAREYGACYIGGVWQGPCAIVVNSDYYSSHAFPYSKYHHTAVITGGSILDGGSMSAKGSSPPSSVGSVEGVIAFQ